MILTSIIAMAIASQAAATSDVVIMRKLLGPSQGQQIGEWAVGPWPDVSQQCGIVKRRRTVTCTRGEGGCTTPRPDDEEEAFGGSTDCPFQWTIGGYGPWNSECSPTAVRYRDVQCVSRGGEVATADQCEIAYKPDPVDTQERYSSCTIAWRTTPWSGSCVRSEPRTRKATCFIEEHSIPVSDDTCTTPKPDLVQQVDAPDRCDNQWLTGEWSSWSSRCSLTATRTRTVDCIDDSGAVLADTRCATTKKPETAQVGAITDACEKPIQENHTYRWITGSYGEWDSTCSVAAKRGRPVTCVDELDRPSSDERCTTAKPQDVEVKEAYEGCASAWTRGPWGEWSSTCSVTAERQRTIGCTLTDGNTLSRPQPEENCEVATRPATSETAPNYASCTYQWKAGDFVTPQGCGKVTSTRRVSCTRVGGDEAVVEDSLCTGDRPVATQESEDMRACTYEWKIGDWTQWSSTCSRTAQRSRMRSCYRTQGDQPVDEKFCAGAVSGDLSETSWIVSGCTHDWKTTPTSAWTKEEQCSTTETRTQTASCFRSDGEAAADEQCKAARPSSTETRSVPASCSYDWAVAYEGTVNSCGTTTGVVSCKRNDGTKVEDAMCDPAKKPAGTKTSYEGCTYSWVSTPITTYDSTCANNSSRTATVSCQRQDGTPASSDSLCTGAKPNTTQSGINTSGCATAYANTSFDAGGGWTGATFTATGGRSGGGMAGSIGNGRTMSQTSTGRLKTRSRYRVEFWAYAPNGGNLFVTMTTPDYTSHQNNSNFQNGYYRGMTIDRTWRRYSVTMETIAGRADVAVPITLSFATENGSVNVDDVAFYAIAP